MKSVFKVLTLCLVLLLSYSIVSAGEMSESYSLWIGGHYTDFSDYTKKVGEYNLGNDEEFLPEFKAYYLSKFDNGFMNIDGHYYDDQNINGKLTTIVGNKFKAKFQYRSLTHQEGQDLMANMEVREYLPATGAPGGKMVTHEILAGWQ